MDATPDSPGSGHRPTLLAWAVHLLTASGVVLALLSLAAIYREAWREALLWLFAALLIDGIDGTLARAVRIKERVPRIDGEVLDLVVDYLGYVLVPAIFLWQARLLPELLALPLAALILLSSLYTFARRDMKTDDGYFRGFPALWNLVALYFFAMPPSAAVGTAVILVLAAMTFAPVHVVHPFRVRDYGAWLLVLSGIWAASTALLLVPGLGYELVASLLTISLAAALTLVALGLVRTFRGPLAERHSSPEGEGAI